MLEPTGVRLEFVDNGQTAVEQVLKEASSDRPYDLVLMDMQMPIKSGYEATRMLRNHGISVHCDRLDSGSHGWGSRALLSAGCTNYLTKTHRSR